MSFLHALNNKVCQTTECWFIAVWLNHKNKNTNSTYSSFEEHSIAWQMVRAEQSAQNSYCYFKQVDVMELVERYRQAICHPVLCLSEVCDKELTVDVFYNYIFIYKINVYNTNRSKSCQSWQFYKLGETLAPFPCQLGQQPGPPPTFYTITLGPPRTLH